EKEIVESAEWDSRINEILEKIKCLKKGSISQPNACGAGRETSTPIRARRSTEDIHELASNGNVFNRSSASTASNGGMRLPKLNLPRYNGDVTRYTSFWQSFESSIHNNDTISPVNKLNYLVNLLEGPAHRALAGLELTEENYQNAIETLKSRFGNKQMIITSHMQALLKLQNSPNDKVSQLRYIYDNINIHVRGLKSLGMSEEKYGSLLVPIIMSRMPREITLQVARKITEEVWPIREILEIVRKEIEAREISDSVESSEKRQEKTAPKPNCQQGTTRSFIAKQNNAIQCYFCGKNHVSSNCDEITDVRERKKILINSKRCFHCLKTGHIGK
ncbi:MAG: DUF1759 domain-containing protein, partial [Bacteroidetes bacterium]|nr:DUF1759 domain-containing protein [Bacteroidota bacterium]